MDNATTRDSGSDLPTDPKDLVKALDTYVQWEVSRFTPRATMLSLFYLYLNGVREFPVLNFQSGEIRYNYENDFGKLQYRHQQLLSTIDRFVGRLDSMDVGPVVTNKQFGLGAVRERATAQVIADAMTTPRLLSAARHDFNTMLAHNGAAGMQVHVERGPDGQFGVDYEVVHPVEILSYPSVGLDRTKSRGLIRRRFVPLSFIEKKYGKKKVSQNLEKMDVWKTPYGNETSEVSPFYGTMNVSPGGMGASGGGRARGGSGMNAESSKQTRKEHELVVELREVWLKGALGYVDRYIVQLGDWVPEDEDYKKKGLTVICPIVFERLVDSGSFYGQGLMDLLMPLNREIETMLSKMFENVRTIDKYGMLLLPQGSVDRRVQFHDSGVGLKTAFWEPEAWYGNQQRPLAISPVTSGDMPGRTAATAQEFMEQIVPTPAILQGDAPGRVDSASGLQFLGQQANNLIAPAIAAVERAFGEIHRAAVNLSIRKFIEAREVLDPEAAPSEDNLGPMPVIPISRMDESLAGAVVTVRKDDGSVMLELGKNPLPDQSKLNFSIRDTEPKNKLGRRREVLELFGQGLISPQQVQFTNLKEGLDLPIFAPHWEGSYRKVVLNILQLFNDGKTPGQIMAVDTLDVAEVHLMVLNGFMSTPEFAVASVEVQDSFIRYKQDLMGTLGEVLPGTTPPPDDAALLDEAGGVLAQVQQIAAQQGAGGGPPQQ